MVKYVKVEAGKVTDTSDEPKPGYVPSNNENVQVGDRHQDQGQGQSGQTGQGQSGQTPPKK